MIIEQRLERATFGLGLRERRQSRLNVLSNGLTGLVAGLVECQMFERPQCATFSVRPGDDPCLVSRGLHAKNQTTNLGVPELIGGDLGAPT